MTLEELKKEIDAGMNRTGGVPFLWDYDEALALIDRVEGVVMELKEEIRIANEESYYAAAKKKHLQQWVDRLEGKE